MNTHLVSYNWSNQAIFMIYRVIIEDGASISEKRSGELYLNVNPYTAREKTRRRIIPVI